MSTVQAPIQHAPTTKLTASIKLVDEAQAKTNLLGMTQVAAVPITFKSIGEKPFRCDAGDEVDLSARGDGL